MTHPSTVVCRSTPPWRNPAIVSAVVLLTACAVACGSEPGADVPAETGSDTDVTGDAPDASTDTASPGCTGTSGFDCATDCVTDVIAPAECVDGAWACPPGFPQRYDECESNCGGERQTCCAPNSGVPMAPQVCVLGAWSCVEGGPEYCLESACTVAEPPCCDEDARPVRALCSGGGWACPDGTGVDACGETIDVTGTWHEVARLDCDGGDLPAGEDPVAELVIADGFTLTFASGMFETFRNYWGTYRYEVDSGRFEMRVQGGDTRTDWVDLEGSVIRVDGRVLFRDLWLGSVDNDRNPGMCGYVMERY